MVIKNISESLIKFTNDEVKEKLFNAMNADIKSIFEIITEHMKVNEIPMSKLKILPPQTVLELGIDLGNINPDEYATLLDKQGLPLTKRVETLTDTGLTINKEVANLPSFIVSTTHMIDAAIQHMSSFKSLQEYKEKFKKFAGIVPIHDAVNSDPHYAVINDKNYVEATIEVNTKYDKVQALIATAKALGITNNEVINISFSFSVIKIELLGFVNLIIISSTCVIYLLSIFSFELNSSTSLKSIVPV